MMKIAALLLTISHLLFVRAELPPPIPTPRRGGATKQAALAPQISHRTTEIERGLPLASPEVQREAKTSMVHLKDTTSSIPSRISSPVVRNTLASLGTFAACTWFTATQATAFSPVWCASVAGLLITSFAAAFSAQPGTNVRSDLHHQVYWPALFALHTFALSGPFLLGGMLLKSTLSASFSAPLIFVSIATISVGCITEVLAHVQDAWVFHKKSEAYKGLNNKIFSTSIVGGFSFLAAALNPSLRSNMAAMACSSLLIAMAATDKWSQGVVYGLQSATAAWVAQAFMSRFRTAWPLLYFCQAFNIVRCSKRMLAGYTQQLHLLPSMYGWFSYIFPFGLGLHPSTRASGIGKVLATCALSIMGTNAVEQWMQRRYMRKISKEEGNR